MWGTSTKINTPLIQPIKASLHCSLLLCCSVVVVVVTLFTCCVTIIVVAVNVHTHCNKQHVISQYMTVWTCIDVSSHVCCRFRDAPPYHWLLLLLQMLLLLLLLKRLDYELGMPQPASTLAIMTPYVQQLREQYYCWCCFCCWCYNLTTARYRCCSPTLYAILAAAPQQQHCSNSTNSCHSQWLP
jgi:hypothetical protein